MGVGVLLTVAGTEQVPDQRLDPLAARGADLSDHRAVLRTAQDVARGPGPARPAGGGAGPGGPGRARAGRLPVRASPGPVRMVRLRRSARSAWRATVSAAGGKVTAAPAGP